MGRCLSVHVILDLFGKDIGGQNLVLRTLEPVPCGLFAHAEHALQHLDDVVLKVAVGVAGLEPGLAVDALKGLAELLGLAQGIDVVLELCKLEVLAVEAARLVEHALKAAKQRRGSRIALLPLARLAIDVKEDGLRGHRAGALHGSRDHGVDDLAVKVADGALAADLAILEQVAQHLEEVRFTGTEETTDPHADLVGARIDGIAVGLEERGKVPLQLARHHVLVKLLADGPIF